MVICISGFSSEDDDFAESWKAVVEASEGVPVFAYRWPSSKSDDLRAPVKKHGAVLAATGMGIMKGLWGKKVKDEKTGESKTK